jgi:hypothetical protein
VHFLFILKMLYILGIKYTSLFSITFILNTFHTACTKESCLFLGSLHMCLTIYDNIYSMYPLRIHIPNWCPVTWQLHFLKAILENYSDILDTVYHPSFFQTTMFLLLPFLKPCTLSTSCKGPNKVRFPILSSNLRKEKEPTSSCLLFEVSRTKNIIKKIAQEGLLHNSQIISKLYQYYSFWYITFMIIY